MYLLGTSSLFGEAVGMVGVMRVKANVGMWGSFLELFKNAY